MPCGSVVFLRRYAPLGLFALLALIFTLFVFGYADRDLWFDEALTVLNFAVMESARQIYHSYFIPNNQILHTIFLSGYLKSFPGLPLRLLPMLCAFATLMILWQNRLKYGKLPLFIALTALAVSPGFLIYATALRGYMLCAMFTVLALAGAETFVRNGRILPYLLWFFSCTAALGVMPGSLAALAAVVLYVMPGFGRKFYCSKNFYLLGAAPAAGFLLFYLPIWQQLAANARLGEGWHNGWEMLAALYGAAGLSFITLLVLPGRWRKVPWQHWLIWLLPVPAAFCFKVAPFPRVFFPLLVIWALLLSGNVKHFMAVLCNKYGRKAAYAGGAVLFAVTLGWGYFANMDTPLRREISAGLSRGGQDDYIMPHFVRPEFTPAETIRSIHEFTGSDGSAEIFATFAADPWALMFYHGNMIKFDGPRSRINSLPHGTVVVSAVDEKIDDIAGRFGVRLVPVFENGQHKVTVVSNE